MSSVGQNIRHGPYSVSGALLNSKLVTVTVGSDASEMVDFPEKLRPSHMVAAV